MAQKKGCCGQDGMAEIVNVNAKEKENKKGMS
jgi:hypothetical protein